LQETLEKMYHFNHKPENWDVKDYAPGVTKKKKDDSQWGAGRARRVMGLAYTLAFTCLLRVDEVLKVQSHDIILLGEHKIQLTLPFRKTSQFGGEDVSFHCKSFKLAHVAYPDIKPFVLHEMPESMAHLCPVRAYAEWIKVSEITSGFVFRKIASGDRVSGDNKQMACPFNCCDVDVVLLIMFVSADCGMLPGDVPQQLA